jgi:hypothetical protein
MGTREAAVRREGSIGRALGVAAALLVAGPAQAGPPPSAGVAVLAPTSPPPPRAILLKLKQFDQGTVRRALDLALEMLAAPDCSEVYAEFRRPDGRTPRDELARLGIGPEAFLERLVFTDGSRETVCRQGRAVMTATVGRTLVFVCPGFAAFQVGNPRQSAAVVIHESLHALGVGENPPSAGEITRRVERLCWKRADPARGSSLPP